ncbi:MAG TPA: thiamine pyrophosphate-binding protein [Polyangiaceae bacterium]|jgi:acetolactate synthase-1/2/3 large subunit
MEQASPISEIRPSPRRELSAARALLETLAHRGVRHVFGIPGGLISTVFDAIADVPAVDLTVTRHENIAAFAAMGYAAATGRPAVVLTTSGPGITNVVTGLAAAHAEELPLIVLAGDVPSSGRGRASIQDSSTNAIDAVAMLRTVTRWSARVENAASAASAAEQAYRLATGPRPGPVFLSLPLDVGSALARPLAMALPTAHAEDPDVAATSQIAEALAGARRPLLVAGNGARFAARELRALAERLAIPVVTTPHAKGVFPDSHPLHLGGIGFGGHPSVDDYLRGGPDVVCVVGSRLGDTTTNGWTQRIEGSESTFQIDREPLAVGQNLCVTLGMVCDAATALRAIHAAIPVDATMPLRPLRPRRLRPESVDGRGAMHPARVLALLQAAFPDAIFTVDQGEHTAFALHYMTIDEPDAFRAMLGLGSMGSGIGAAIGMKRAYPDRTVVCICGDGGLAMHAGELLTCAENGMGIVFAVFNDGRYNMIHHGFRTVFGRSPSALPAYMADLAQTATSFGATGVRVETPRDLEPAVLRALARAGRPVLLDVRFDADVTLSASTRSTSLKQAAFGGAL